MENKILDVFKKALELDDDIDSSTLVYNETKNWDSLAHMNIIAALEESFDCMLEMDDILDMSNFSKAVEIMKKYS